MNLLYGLGSKLKDKKLKMVLLTAMYLILFSAVLLLLTLSDAAQKQIEHIDKYIEREVSIKSDKEALCEDTVNQISKVDCIEEYNVMLMSGIRLKGSKPVIKDEDRYQAYLKDKKMQAKEVFKEEFNIENLSEILLIGTSSTDNSLFFLNKGLRIIEGEGIKEEDEGEAVISKEFAELNHLQVGDYIETVPCANDLDWELKYPSALEQKLKVKGIFTHTDPVYQGGPSSYKSNYIFTSTGALLRTRMAYERMTIYLKKGYTISDLKDQIAEEIPSLNMNGYEFGSSNEWGDILSGPLRNMQAMSGFLLVVMLVSILVIIFFLGAFYLRGNLHNIGVMLSMGIRKSKIVFQLLLEECIPLLLGALLALLIGGGNVGTVSQMVDSQYTSELQNISAEKNKEILEGNKLYVSNPVNELRARGQVMRMEGDFAAEYRLDWNTILLFFSMAGIFLPAFVSVQILYKIKHSSIKKILLS